MHCHAALKAEATGLGRWNKRNIMRVTSIKDAQEGGSGDGYDSEDP